MFIAGWIMVPMKNGAAPERMAQIQVKTSSIDSWWRKKRLLLRLQISSR